MRTNAIRRRAGNLRYRSIFISDVHLGTRECRAEYLLDFLESTDCDRLYLVGDIFDLWSMRKSVYWNPDHSAVVQAVFDKARDGTEVIYIPGNHDELMRDFIGAEFSGVRLMRNAIHVTADGRRFFVSHGDEFDGLVKHNRVLKFIGDGAYNLLLAGNRRFNVLRRRLGYRYWSLSSYLKTRVNNAVQYIRKFEETAAQTARRENCDGYICGHIHKAGIESIDEVLYANTGDWVEHCTALVEDFHGRLQLLHWSDARRVEIVHGAEGVMAAGMPLLVARRLGMDTFGLRQTAGRR